MDAEQASAKVEQIVENMKQDIGREIQARSYSVANELNNSILYVLSGQRHGRRYKKPGTFKRQRDKATNRMRNGVYYTASAPGEAPANRTGIFRLSFGRRVYADGANGAMMYHAVTESNYKVKNGDLLGEIMEQGTKDGRIAPRPFKKATIDRAMPKVRRIYGQQYFR